MAILNLQPPQWEYDTVTKELVAIFVESAPDGTPDPANWNPTRRATVRIPIPAGTTITQITQLPDPPPVIP